MSNQSKVNDKPPINLLLGWPHESLLPSSLLQDAYQAVLRNPVKARDALQYGASYHGYMPLRQGMAEWLTEFYAPKDKIDVERIAITGGASQNLAVMLSVCTDPIYTRKIWIIVPSYMLAFRTFADHGFHKKMRAVPEGEEGIDLDYLRRELEKEDSITNAPGSNLVKPDRPWTKLYRHVIYCVPTFSNPSGTTMSLSAREALVTLARKHDALIISDDVYDFLQWPVDSTVPITQQKAALPRLVDIDRYLDGGHAQDGAHGYGNTASNGSFSKICAPGLRCGWVEGTPKLANAVASVLVQTSQLANASALFQNHFLTWARSGTTWSSSATSQTQSVVISEAVASSRLKDNMYSILQPAYAKRYRTLIAAISRHLIPFGITLPQSGREIVGGYFVWLTLPKELDGEEVANRAKKSENLVVAAGIAFQVPDDSSPCNKFDKNLRLCWSYAEECDLEVGIERLGRTIRVMLKGEDK